jgi:hypothetical protein
MVAREERRAKSADNEGGPVENNGGGGDWKTQPTLPGASKRMVRDGQPWFFHPPRRKWVLDTNRISATVSPAALSATPAIVPPETIAPMSPAPAENIPAINTVTGTLLPGQMTRASIESLFRERELSITKAQQGKKL